ncbi:2'-5' RNA ligase family protein [Ralstonia soli]|uniref:2'-5' RNA ligase family protein n=1 Tax=Ralstonia soli TaxID=2953896 RepID=A0ABT1AED7_9RALS|nr:2'-5' RNA ligase family protein [Ralstonia soli]MCO5396748.1 2'-5' RNA ligase family protein [Ralstonia soli]
MSVSALVVKVPAADGLVGDLRDRFDATARLGVPAHITVLFPFMPPDEITSGVLEQTQTALNAVPSFSFSLASVGRFPTTAYLSPTPQDPFVALTTVLTKCFPKFQPYASAHADVVPHLTVAHGDAVNAQAVAMELERRLGESTPILARCGSIALLENSSGRWRELHTFALPIASQHD